MANIPIAEPLAKVRPLRPIRVLLAGREVRYLRAMAFLFGRRGYDTQLSLRPAMLFDDVGSFRPDVAVLVEDDSFAAAVGRAMALIGRNERVHVVLSTSRAGAPDSTQVRFVPKWGTFAELAAAVEAAWLALPPS
jgi:hypothetical protein